MTVDRSMRAVPILAAALLLAGVGGASAEGCRTTAFTDPPREVLACADGLTVTAEKQADYRLIERDGRPVGAELRGRGILIEVPPGRRNGFQVLTPHAIASVRGTTWAVDVTGRATAVFVRAGRVAVSRPQGPTVTLGPGDGVDVESTGGLTVRQWPRERALHLLARFGR
ncbi:hypothetical protein ASG40_16110 [Methylobacterium sp. Leaf399]|nr:hypothetical protein ASG40_16110 [Methylobacterium sp. Leaf399]